MKNKFVADGPLRFLRAKKAALSQDIEKKYARQLAEADSIQKRQIRKQMAEEYSQRQKIEGHKPSGATLW
ncbi:MAG: hypothetical protein ACLP2Y_07175 [Limisphaerales bacterium]